MASLLEFVLTLSLASWFWLLSSFTAAYCLGWIAYARWFHPLRKIPGPWLATVSRTWYMLQITRGDMEKTQRSLHEKYGPLVRVAPNEVSCSDATAIKTIYRTQGAFDKTDFYPVWNTQSFSKHPDLFTELNDKAHGERRRIMNNVYSLANVLKSETYIDGCSELFLQRLSENVDAIEPFDLGTWVQWYAFDVIGELYFGDRFGFLEHSHDHNGWIHSLDLLLPFVVVNGVAPTSLRPLVRILALLIPGGLTGLNAINNIAAAARSCVARRLGKPTERTDILAQLHNIYLEKGAKVDFGLGDIEQEAYIALLAGSDTTSIGFRAVFYHLMRNPEIYRELERVIDQAAEEGQLSHPVKHSEAIKLPFLCACIKEALRLHPGVQLNLPRIVPAGGLELNGTYIPAGYWVGMNAAVTHFDTSVFGADADQYRPGRWLEPNAAVMDKHLLTFGAGTRTCVGKNISLAEVHKLVPDVLRHYELELSHDRPWTTNNLWFNKQEDVLVWVKRRNKIQ